MLTNGVIKPRVGKLPTRLSAVVAGLMISAGGYAANPEPVTVEVEFITPIAISENVALRFGLLDEALANGETVVIATNGSVTDASSRVYGGTQSAADLTVDATIAQSITILVATSGVAPNGYALGSFTCDYNGGAALGPCGGGLSAASVPSADLLVGATLTGNGAAGVGTDNGTIDITVSYQ